MEFTREKRITIRFYGKEVNYIEGLAKMQTGGDVSKFIRSRIFSGDVVGRRKK